MTELERYTAWRARRLASRPSDFGRLEKPGYLFPPLHYILVPDSRSGSGSNVFNPIPSLQSEIQMKMQGWVGMYGTFDLDLMRQLIRQNMEDSIAYLGNLDPDTNPIVVDKLVKDYTEIYRLAATPV